MISQMRQWWWQTKCINMMRHEIYRCNRDDMHQYKNNCVHDMCCFVLMKPPLLALLSFRRNISSSATTIRMIDIMIFRTAPTLICNCKAICWDKHGWQLATKSPRRSSVISCLSSLDIPPPPPSMFVLLMAEGGWCWWGILLLFEALYIIDNDILFGNSIIIVSRSKPTHWCTLGMLSLLHQRVWYTRYVVFD